MKPVLRPYRPTPPKIRLLVLERDGYTCRECGRTDRLHVHHIKPYRIGGTHDMDNLVTLCVSCHPQQERPYTHSRQAGENHWTHSPPGPDYVRRGRGGWRRQQPEGLEEAIATLRRRLELTRARGIGTYQQRQEIFKAIDALQEQAEVYLCEAPDYPGEPD